jgi:protein DEK
VPRKSNNKEQVMAEEREDQTAMEMVENAEQTEGKAVENHQTGKEQEVAVVEDVKGDAMDIEEKGKLEAGIGTKENEKAEDKELEGAKEELVQVEEGKEEEKTEKEEEEEEKEKEEEEKEEEEEEEREEEEKEEEEEEEREEEENGTPVSTKKRPGRVKKGRTKSEEISTPRGSSGKRQRQRTEIFPFFTDRPTRERKSIERFIAFVEKDTNKEVQIKKVYNITR